jgi:hypothetical protein
MTTTTSQGRDPTALPEALASLLIGHLYWDVGGGRLYRLNEAARQLHDDGIPFLGSEPGIDYLRTAEGQPVPAEDLPLSTALREGRPADASLVFLRPGRLPWYLVWSATPLRDVAGRVTGVMATVCRTPPPPEWHTLAGLAHDLRTPFQTIRLILTALGQRSLTPAQQTELIDMLRSASERALQIGGDLLDWCRVPGRSGRRAQFAWEPLEPFLTGLLKERLPYAAPKGVAMAAALAEARDWQIYTDQVRLGRVITNLLVNAVRYTPSAGRVTLTASWQGVPGERVLAIGVSDTGVGISPEEQESIFQPFERGRGSRGDSSGSGLGLAVVEELVEELGLRRELSSETGRGSIFRLMVPQRLLRRTPAPVPGCGIAGGASPA